MAGLSKKQRALLFQEHRGICHICQRQIAPGEPWDDEHVIAKCNGGTDAWENRRPAHVDCHRGKGGKTAKDRAVMAKTDRMRLKHLGLWKSRTPMRRRKRDQRSDGGDKLEDAD